jgi:hypothetical protein
MKLCRSKAPVQARTTDNPDRKFEAPTCELIHGHDDDHLATVCDYMVQITWKKNEYRGITGKAR